jgi:hypothetical protein
LSLLGKERKAQTCLPQITERNNLEVILYTQGFTTSAELTTTNKQPSHLAAWLVAKTQISGSFLHPISVTN